MKYYYIDFIDIKNIPIDLYRDKVIILTMYFDTPGKHQYFISFDYATYRTLYNDLLLFDITDEDMVHLNLMGVKINPLREIDTPDLLLFLNESLVDRPKKELS